MLLKSSVVIMSPLLLAHHPTSVVFYNAVIQNTNILKQQSSQPSLHGQKIFYSTFRMNMRLLVAVWSNGDGQTVFGLLIPSQNIFIGFLWRRKLSSAIIIMMYGVKNCVLISMFSIVKLSFREEWHFSENICVFVVLQFKEMALCSDITQVYLAFRYIKLWQNK